MALPLCGRLISPLFTGPYRVTSKILPLNSGGDCVQNQFSSRAVESALPFAMALSFKEGRYLQDKGALERRRSR